MWIHFLAPLQSMEAILYSLGKVIPLKTIILTSLVCGRLNKKCKKEVLVYFIITGKSPHTKMLWGDLLVP